MGGRDGPCGMRSGMFVDERSIISGDSVTFSEMLKGHGYTCKDSIGQNTSVVTSSAKILD